MTLQYLLDENVGHNLAEGLRRQTPPVVVRVVGGPDAPMLSTLDPAILIWCEEHNFVLVTNNRRSMPVHLADHLGMGRHVPGIFVLNPGLGLSETIENLHDAATLSLPDEYRDQIRHLPL